MYKNERIIMDKEKQINIDVTENENIFFEDINDFDKFVDSLDNAEK